MATEAEFRSKIEVMQNQIHGVIADLHQLRENHPPGVAQRILEIEQRILALEGKAEFKDTRSGLAKIFDGKNPRLLPPTFAKEEGFKTFRKWATQVETYVELADPRARQAMKIAEDKDITITEEIESKYSEQNMQLHGLLMMLTDGEAQNIIEANPKKGISGWRQLHERWNKRTKMSSVMLLEQIRSMPKCKTLDE
eukprot:7416242-Karenia_brevis.AAC.1